MTKEERKEFEETRVNLIKALERMQLSIDNTITKLTKAETEEDIYSATLIFNNEVEMNVKELKV